MRAMDDERYGLPVFRKYGVAATAFFQGVDLFMKPWLREEMALGSSIEWGNSTFSHSLVPRFKSAWRDETAQQRGTVPVTFFAEFCLPPPNQVPTKFTMVLAGHSSLYSEFGDPRAQEGYDIDVVEYPEDTHAIRFGDKIGILMREEWYKPLLDAYFVFQRFPVPGSDPTGRDRLAELVTEIRKIADDERERIVVVPLDLEAPWIGSHFGGQVWEILFAELKRLELIDVFVPLSSCLERFEQEAVKAPRPHRDLIKWMSTDKQVDHVSAINELEPRSFDEAIVKMIASGSDIFSAWHSKTRQLKSHIVLTAARPDGRVENIKVGYNQSIIDVQRAAFLAVKRGTPFLKELQSLTHPDGTAKEPDYFVKMAIDMATHERW